MYLQVFLKEWMNEIKQNTAIMQKISVVIVANILLAILALVREITIAAWYGTSAAVDVYVVGLFLSDIPGSLLLGNALFSVTLPLYTKLMERSGPEEGNEKTGQLFKRVLVPVLIACGVWFTLSWLLAPWIISIAAPGVYARSGAYAASLFRIMLPLGIFACLYFVISALLVSRRRFGAYAYGQVLQNVVLLLFVFFFAKYAGIKGLAYGITCGYLVMMLLVLADLARSEKGRLLRSNPPRKEADVNEYYHKFKKLLGPALLAVAVVQVIPFSERYFASLISAGTVASMNYAYKLAQFPVWTFASAVVLVLFPEMAAGSEMGNETLIRFIKKGIVVLSLVLIPIAAIMALFPEFLIKLVLEHRAFGPESTHLTAQILRAYAFGIPFIGVNSLLIRAYHSLLDTRTPLRVIVAASAVNLLGNILSYTRWGAPGLAACASIAAVLTFMLLTYKLSKKMPGWQAYWR